MSTAKPRLEFVIANRTFEMSADDYMDRSADGHAAGILAISKHLKTYGNSK